jgi:hypothetical protein
VIFNSMAANVAAETAPPAAQAAAVANTMDAHR